MAKRTNQKVYIFGNPLLKEDSLPLKMVKDLQKEFPSIGFIIKDPNENLWPNNGELVIIDTATGIEKVEMIDDILKVQTEKTPYSLHDFDLALNLKLLEKIGKLRKVTIFVVPQRTTKKDALDQLVKSIDKYLNKPKLNPVDLEKM